MPDIPPVYLDDYIVGLLKDRDTLLAALEVAVQALAPLSTYPAPVANAVSIIRAAISEVEGERP